MTMLAEVVDAVIGGDTHRDTHALEMLAPNGATITTLAIANDDEGFVEQSRGSPSTRLDHGSSSGWKARAVTGSA